MNPKKTTYIFTQTLFLFFLSLSLLSESTFADEIYTFIIKKQETKTKNQWSLSEWLETRDKMRLMDLWLALHSPSPYEFFLDTSYHFSNQSTQQNFNSYRILGGAYASMFGLEFERSGTQLTETLGSFNVRFFWLPHPRNTFEFSNRDSTPFQSHYR